jgi:inner membrane protein
VDWLNIIGHAGLTLGGIYAVGYRVDMLSARRYGYGTGTPKLDGSGSLFSRLQAWPRSLERLGLDFRMVLLGSLLPDIIDKPLGFFLLPEAVNFNARSVGHSLSFNVLLLSVALLLLVMTRALAPLILVWSSMAHLLLDHMWRWPEKLLWPWYGWEFPRGSTKFSEWLSFQFSGEWFDLPELTGALFLTWFAIQLYRHRAVLQFIKVGTLRR